MQGQSIEQTCEMLGAEGVIIQVVLALLSFSVLIIKRFQQNPKRKWKIWALDISKQGVSQFIAHFINVGISINLSTHLSHDACLWYFMINVLDNTLGVLICIMILKMLEKTMLIGKFSKYKSGNYYRCVHEAIDFNLSKSGTTIRTSSNFDDQITLSEPKRKMIIHYDTWFAQLVIWNIIVSLCKLILFEFESFANAPLNAFSEFLLGWVKPYPVLQLLLVIIALPLIFNGLAFWVQDSSLKKSNEQIQQQENQIRSCPVIILKPMKNSSVAFL